MPLKYWFRFLLLGLIWGSSFFWIKIALRETGPFTLVTIRVSFAILATIAVLLSTRAEVPVRRYWKAFLGLGLLNTALPFALISWAELHISSGMAAILNSTVPLFTILIAPIFLKDDPFSLPKVVGLILGFTGVVVLMSDQLGVSNSSLWGYGGMLLAAISYAAAGVFARRTTTGLKPEVQTLGQMVSAFLFIFPVASTIEAPFRLPQLPLTWIALAWLGILGTSIATVIYFSLLHNIGPTRTVLVTYLFPLVGVLLGVVILNEDFGWRQALGGLMIISGIVVVNARRYWKIARKETGEVV